MVPGWNFQPFSKIIINNEFPNVPYRNLVTPFHGTPILGSGNGFMLIAKRIKTLLFENQMLLNEEEIETTEIEETPFTQITPDLKSRMPELIDEDF